MSDFSNFSRRKFILGASCMCSSALILPSCAEVAMSDRKQIKIFSDDYLYSKAFPAYENFKSQTKLITGTNESQNIVDIGFNIKDAINKYYNNLGEEDPTSNFQWEFVLVDDDQTKNAWCMPGGKIAFYTGIMPIASNNDGIASIMGHEIAHAVARHSSERMSTAILVDAGTYALERLVLGQRLPSISKQLRTYGLDLPFNRKQESEADYLGIIFSNLAGYNIDESYKIWERMQKEGGASPSEFFSTHPSPQNRINKLKEWIPEVRSKYPSIKT
ncbi:MAG: Beta-barrel assembly-enhancing protease [Alphaproteobacteria bacterium MarineAlpha5_Bin9]|nr:MAG: Beta-barrel assembly-enhancing protease [Alphaproteobacteria bacterium MarineAlpha5_Bin9]|tara:strand:+ start:632 stop:1453 length:822 start_codon:yes stop_codon:yes gene_type:complete